MKNHFLLEDLINWRSAQAEADAPPPPRAARLLELMRPWWQVQPERFRALLQQFDTMMRVGYAMDPDRAQRENHPVPAVVAQTNVETNALADILYLSVRGRTLRLRFALRAAPELRRSKLEVTFVAADSPDPLFFSTATLGPDGDYRVEMELPAKLAEDWSRLRVTERMPFRFILRPQDES
ncbi:MAG TPA: hypothetical protein VHF69_11310 [Candidatus Synoicihabitans sp.]|nr:hypothetical protein [Candidatus Synoicihabitans sp.]